MEKEGASSVTQGIRGYLRRKGYRRLERRRPWRRIRVRPRLKILRRLSPVRFLGKIRDAYVKMMMGVANSRVFAGGYGGEWGTGFGAPPVKEYDEKVIVEIYKMMVANDMAMAKVPDVCR